MMQCGSVTLSDSNCFSAEVCAVLCVWCLVCVVWWTGLSGEFTLCAIRKLQLHQHQHQEPAHTQVYIYDAVARRLGDPPAVEKEKHAHGV